MADLRDNMDLGRLCVIRDADRRRVTKYRRAYALLAAWMGETGAAGAEGRVSRAS